jgi:L-ascorbate metabolism protein UlaG (beta-lactamase superfamily)
MNRKVYCRLLAAALACASAAAWAQTVKITPLGSHNGELCDRDRATLFEDPSGVRILYDAGQTLTGTGDPRLGDVHVVLLSHAHGDHIGDRKLGALNAGTCEKPQTVSAAPNSITAEVAAAKNSALVMVSDLGAFIARKIENIRGKPTGTCAQADGAVVVPAEAPCLATSQLGGTQKIKRSGAKSAVEITIVYASHASNVPRELLSDPEKANLAADNMSISLGPPTGYVIRFTNGLTAYLSGDTGLFGDMKSVVHDYHKANLAVMNLGPNAVAPDAAAYAINELIQPASVIASHPNEGVTAGGKIRPESRTKRFVDLVRGRPVYPALSGKVMEFDGNAKCVAGC